MFHPVSTGVVNRKRQRTPHRGLSDDEVSFLERKNRLKMMLHDPDPEIADWVDETLGVRAVKHKGEVRIDGTCDCHPDPIFDRT